MGAGAFTRVYTGEKGIYAKAGLVAATYWATGVVLRTAFSVYASDGGASAGRVYFGLRSRTATSPTASRPLTRS